MSFSETIFLFFLALIIFGPKKLPEIARQVGKYMNEFRRASNEFKAQIEQEIAHLDVETNRQTILPPSPPVEGTASRTPEIIAAEVSYADAGNPSEVPLAPEQATLAPPAGEAAPPHDNGAAPIATEASHQATADSAEADPANANAANAHPAEAHPSDEVTSPASRESHA